MWAAELNPLGLSQGDILREVPTGSTRIPLTFLSKDHYENPRAGKVTYTQYPTLQEYPNEPGMGHWIAKGRISLALVVTHDCDLDDAEDSERIVVAPVFPISRITGNQQASDRIMAGGRATYVPLPNLPGSGDCYAELRSLCPLDRRLFDPVASRVCSMTDEGLAVVQAHFVHYFTRIKPATLAKALREQAEADAAAAAVAEAQTGK